MMDLPVETFIIYSLISFYNFWIFLNYYLHLHFLTLLQLMIFILQIGQDASYPFLVIHFLIHFLWKLSWPHSSFSLMRFFAFCPGIPNLKTTSEQIEHSVSSEFPHGSLMLLFSESMMVKWPESASDFIGSANFCIIYANLSIFCSLILASSYRFLYLISFFYSSS